MLRPVCDKGNIRRIGPWGRWRVTSALEMRALFPPAPHAFEALVRPACEAVKLPKLTHHLHILLLSAVFYHSIYLVSSYVSPKISSSYRKLNKKTKINWDIHTVSMVQVCSRRSLVEDRTDQLVNCDSFPNLLCIHQRPGYQKGQIIWILGICRWCLCDRLWIFPVGCSDIDILCRVVWLRLRLSWYCQLANLSLFLCPFLAILWTSVSLVWGINAIS